MSNRDVKVWLNEGRLLQPPPVRPWEKAKQSMVFQGLGPETTRALLLPLSLCCRVSEYSLFCALFALLLFSPAMTYLSSSKQVESSFLQGSNTKIMSFLNGPFFLLCFCGVPVCTLIAEPLIDALCIAYKPWGGISSVSVYRQKHP